MSYTCAEQQQQPEKPTEGTVTVKKKSTLLNAALPIIITGCFERMAYYGVATSLVLFMQTELGFTNSQADTQFALWNGACYILPLLGAYAADRWWGRFRTILTFMGVYMIGLPVVTAAASPAIEDVSDTLRLALFYLAIYAIALAAGGLRPNNPTLGADQFQDGDEDQEKERSSFFNWLYWSNNVGALVSRALIAYIAQFGIAKLGGKHNGFTLAFGVSFVAMIFAVCAFVSGSKAYKKTGPSGKSLLGHTFRIVKDAAARSLRAGGDSTAAAGASPTTPAARAPLDALVLEAQSPAASEGSSPSKPGEGAHWLDRACVASGGRHSVEDVGAVKRVWRMLPLVALQVPYFLIYGQAYTSFENQACQMDLQAGSFTIPISSLGNFQIAAILVLIPVFDRLLYPALAALGVCRTATAAATTAAESNAPTAHPTKAARALSPLSRIGVGYALAGLSMLAAGCLELHRKLNVDDGGDAPVSNCLDGVASDYDPAQFQAYYASGAAADMPLHCSQVAGCDTMTAAGLLSESCIACAAMPLASATSVLWQVPQFVLLGVSEILTAISADEYFYAEAPASMKSTCFAMNLLCMAFGCWASIPLMKLVNLGGQWVAADLNTGSLDNLFFLMAAVMAVNTAVYYGWSRYYRRQTGKH